MTIAEITATVTNDLCTTGPNTPKNQFCAHQKATINVRSGFDTSTVADLLMKAMIGENCLERNVKMGLCTAAPTDTLRAYTVTATGARAAGNNWKVVPTLEAGKAITVKIGTTPFATSNGDPHIHRADGKKTDFRGEDGKIFNMLSARNFSLGVRTTASHFMQKHGAQTVHGTHFTEAFFTVRTNKTGTIVTVRADALITPWVDPITLVAISGKEKYPIKLSASTRPTFTIEDVNITAVSGSKVVVRGASWEASVGRRLLYKPLPDSKTKNFLDLSIKRITKDPRALSSHGVIGQSFDPKHRIAKDGKQDDYSAAEVTTTAQAEGAIEGIYTDYLVAAPYQTIFKYSLFDAPPEKASSASYAAAFLSDEASTETNEAGH